VQAGRVVASHQPTKLAAKYFLRVRSCHLIKRYLVTYLVVLAVLMAEPAKTRMSYAPPQKPAEPITKTSRTAGLQQQLFRTLRQIQGLRLLLELFISKKKIIAGASYSPELSAMQVNYFAQNFFSEKEHQGQGERRQCWRTWCSPGCVPPRGRPRRAFEAFEKHLAKEERGRTARGRQFGPTRLRGFRRWRRRGFPWVEET